MELVKKFWGKPIQLELLQKTPCGTQVSKWVKHGVTWYMVLHELSLCSKYKSKVDVLKVHVLKESSVGSALTIML